MKRRALDFVWVLLCGVLSSVWCLTAARDLGVTFDEPIYVERGLERWREGTLSPLIKLGTMPLPVDVQMFPVYVWERFRGTPFDPKADLPIVLPVARAANLVFWWLLLVYTFLAARSLGGPWAGRLAVLLLAVEPSFLGHATLATTDVSVTACLVALTYHFWTGREAGWWRRVGLPAVWFGLACLAKASGPVFGVLAMAAVEAQRRLSGQEKTRFVRDSVQIVGLGVLILFVYCRSDWQPQPDALRWAQKLPEGTGRTVALALVENARVFPTAADGFFRQVGHNVRGHGAYLLGVTHERALWWYFPVLLTVKVTVPLLVLAGALLLLRFRSLGNAACAAAVALAAFSLLCRVQIGVRFMLPLITLGIVGLSAALVEAVRQANPRARLAWGTLAGVAVGWNLIGVALVWPHGLSFVNELYGGTRDGYRVVSESNYDWGHGMPELRRWAERESGGRLAVWYYGADPQARETPLEAVQLHEDVDAHLTRLRGRYLAVSVSLAHGPPLSKQVCAAREKLRELEPVGRTQTFLIYRVTR